MLEPSYLLFFDEKRFKENLATQLPVKVFRDAIQAANTQFDNRFKEGEDIRQLLTERSMFIDRILHHAWHRYTWGSDITLLAVGGYGRGELQPHSDIDLLILYTGELSTQEKENIESLITFLWDLNLSIGHSVRSMDECIAAARDDITIATNLLECATLEGNETLKRMLRKRLQDENVWPSADFFRAKWDEQIARHAKHNNTEYNLEPNLKNAPGGLRDIQTVAWVAKRYFNIEQISQLVGQGFLTEEEYRILRKGEAELWRIRYGLHLLSGREEDRLLFDYQRQLAEMFGYRDTPERPAVEQFMQKYYRAVIALRELNDVLLHYLDDLILKAFEPAVIRPINDFFQVRNNYIEVRRDSVFREHPAALLEIFVYMGRDPDIKGMRAATIRLIRAHRYLVDEEFRAKPENRALFMEILRSPYALVKQLKRMKLYGILGRYLPEFGRIIGQMQHDLFHIYTVDAHTILCVKNIRRFSHPEMESKFPVAAHIVRHLQDPELLIIAGLYHDIGKGRGGDHSELGAVDAEKFCREHGLGRRDTNLVVWLVKKHLLMSTISQRHDISDPEVIYNFALEVGDQRHLDFLYVLTVADVNATNPTLWTSWKDSLMRQLYLETKRALRRGLEKQIDKQDLIDDTQKTAMIRLIDKGFTGPQVHALWEGYGEDYFLRENASDVVWHTDAIARHNSSAPLVLLRDHAVRGLEGATQIFVRAADQKNVFAAVVTALDHLNLSIQDARIYNAQPGFTNYTLFVLDEHNRPIANDSETRQTIVNRLLEELRLLDEHYSDIVQRRTPRQLKYFSMATRTRLSNDIGSGMTVLEVITADRPGLLARIARVFMRFDIRLNNAKIATLGERVEDVFFISDQTGKPLSDPQLCEDLQTAICAALDQQAAPPTPAVISI